MANSITFVDYCLGKIHTIPVQILRGAFKADARYETEPNRNMDYYIRRDVIDQKFRQALNTQGGRITTLYVEEDANVQEVRGGYIYTIPIDVTGGRRIGRVIDIAPAGFNLTGRNPGCTIFERIENQILAGTEGFHTDVSTEVFDTAPNAFFVQRWIPIGTQIKVYLEYDDEFNDIDRGYWAGYGEFALLCAKSIIYTRLAVAMGQSNFEGGQTNQNYQSIVESFSDAEQQVEEFQRTKLSKLSIMSDRNAYRQLGEWQAGGFPF